MAARDYPQDLTHWLASKGEFGLAFGAPTAIKGRWEDSNELFRTPAGEESVSSAIVYLESDVAVGDYLFLGMSIVADPTTLATAKRVQQFNKVPDLSAIEFERRAFL